MRTFESLKENYDFRRIYRSGKYFVSPFMVIYAAKGRKGRIRLGITVSKKVGGAVLRNRAKRIIRAAFGSCVRKIPPSWDFVIVARTKLLSVKSDEAAAVIEKQLRSAGLWCEDETNV